MEPPVCYQYLVKCKPNYPLPPPHEVLLSPDQLIITDTKSIPILLNLAATRDLSTDVLTAIPSPNVTTHVIPSSYKVGCAFSRSSQNNEQKTLDKLVFLKWCHNTFKNIKVYYPSVNHCQSAYMQALGATLAFENIVVSTELFTAGLNGLGILTLQESVPNCEQILYGKPIQIKKNKIIGIEIIGSVQNFVVSTDIVLQFIKLLKPLSECFIEVYGSSLNQISMSDRITIANMAKETPAKCIFFPCDSICAKFLKSLAIQNDKKVTVCKPVVDVTKQRAYDEVIKFDLSEVRTTISGPKRSGDRIFLDIFHKEFLDSIYRKFSPTSFGIKKQSETDATKKLHGIIVKLSLAGCTNSSNAFVNLQAGILAKNLCSHGCFLPDHVQGNFNSGGGLAKLYLEEADLMVSLKKIGLHSIEGCCKESSIIEKSKCDILPNVVTCALLSGNGNYENRKFQDAKANFLMSSPLALLLATIGTVDACLNTDIIHFQSGVDVNVSDIWPNRQELIELECAKVLPAVCMKVYKDFTAFSEQFFKVPSLSGEQFSWNDKSLYIMRPPYLELPSVFGDITQARVLISLSDNVSSELISPSGSMARTSCAARYLNNEGVIVKDYDSYGNRRGNHHVVAMGVFNNTKLVNKLVSMTGPYTKHFPTNTIVDIYDAAKQYQMTYTPTVIIAGHNYGTGTTRDSGARGVRLLGVSAVIAKSFDPNHRRELINLGVLPILCGETDVIDNSCLLSIQWDKVNRCEGVLSWSSADRDVPLSGTVCCKSSVYVAGSATVVLDVESTAQIETLKHGSLLQQRVWDISVKDRSKNSNACIPHNISQVPQNTILHNTVPGNNIIQHTGVPQSGIPLNNVSHNGHIFSPGPNISALPPKIVVPGPYPPNVQWVPVIQYIPVSSPSHCF